MKKLILLITSTITPLFIWALSYYTFHWFIQDIIRESLGVIFYNSYGRAARKYIFLYFVIVFIIAEVAAVLTKKLIKIDINIFLYALFMLAVNFAVLGLIDKNLISVYGFVI